MSLSSKREAANRTASVGRVTSLGAVATAVVLALLAVGVAALEGDRTPSLRMLDPLGVGLLLAGSVPLAVSRRWPVTVYLVTVTAIGAYQALGYLTSSPYFLGVLLAAYMAAARDQRWRSALLALLGFAIGAVGAVVIGRVDLAYGVPSLAAVAFAAGQLASEQRAASERRDELARREADLLLVTEERLRIARDLHDVISHNIAVIGVQAGIGAHLFDQQPEQARAALLIIKAASRDAMRDLRGMLGVLRQADDPQGRDPSPSLAALPELVERVRGAGVVVVFAIEGTARPLTPATELAGYRIVQEALTNVLRHAPGASAEVHLRYVPDAIQVEVFDDGGARSDASPTVSPGTGHGLVGLRERAGTLGGTLEAGPLEAGGFRVWTCLPTGNGT